MAAKSTVEIVIKATDKTKSALSGIMGSLESLQGVAIKVSLAASAAIGLIGIGMWKLSTDAAAFEPVRQAFADLAEAAGTSKDDLLDALREASQGMITDTELMTKANLAMLLIGEQVAGELPGLLEIAQIAALTTGQDFDYMFDSLIRGVGRMSPRILDNLGITIDLADAYEDYASKMGLVVDEMTVAEQQQAVMTAVLEIGGEMLDKVGLKTEDLALVKLEQLKTTFKNLKDQLGQQFIPVLVAVLTPLGELAEEYGPAVVAWGEEFAIVIGDLVNTWLMPLIEVLAEWIGKLLDLDPRIIAWGVAILGILAALGPLLIIAGVIATAIGALAPVFAAIGTVLGLLLSPIGLVVAAVAALALAWATNFGGIRDKTQAVFDFVRPYIETAMGAIQTVIDTVLATVTGWWDENHALIQATTETVWGVIQGFIDTTMAAVSSIIDTVLGTILSWWDENHELILTTTETIWEAIQTFIEDTLNFIMDDIIVPILTFITEFWDEHGETILGIVETVWDAIETYIDTVINAVLGIIKTVMLLISGDWDAAWEEIEGVADTIWEGIKTIVDDAINVVEDTLGIVLGIIKGAWDTTWDNIKTKIDTVWAAIKTAVETKIGEVKTAITTKLDEAKTAITNMAGSFGDAGTAIIEGLISGVKNKAKDMLNAVVDAIRKALNAAKAFLGIACPDPSPVWAELGVGMGEGLIGGFKSMIGDMESTVTQGMGGLLNVAGGSLGGASPVSRSTRATATPTRSRGIEVTRAAGLGNVTVNVNTLEPAPVARRVEQTLRRLSLQAELSAMRG